MTTMYNNTQDPEKAMAALEGTFESANPKDQYNWSDDAGFIWLVVLFSSSIVFINHTCMMLALDTKFRAEFNKSDSRYPAFLAIGIIMAIATSIHLYVDQRYLKKKKAVKSCEKKRDLERAMPPLKTTIKVLKASRLADRPRASAAGCASSPLFS